MCRRKLILTCLACELVSAQDQDGATSWHFPAVVATANTSQSSSPGFSNELPTNGFPGATAAESNAAWPSGHQPSRFAGWPRSTIGDGAWELGNCWKTTVLQDVSDGWADVCMDLFKAASNFNERACRQACLNDPRCATWQYAETNTGAPECWLGAGMDCKRWTGPGSFKVIAGQRIQHGDVRVLRVMDSSLIRNLYNLGRFEDTPEEALLHCQQFCYSLITCQYWQYGESGCYIDAPFFSSERGLDPSRMVEEPLTTHGLDFTTPVISGEMIQHYCPPPSQTTPVLPQAELDGNERVVEYLQPTQNPFVIITFVTLMSCAACATAISVVRANDAIEAASLKAEHGEDSPLIAGGQGDLSMSPSAAEAASPEAVCASPQNGTRSSQFSKLSPASPAPAGLLRSASWDQDPRNAQLSSPPLPRIPAPLVMSPWSQPMGRSLPASSHESR